MVADGVFWVPGQARAQPRYWPFRTHPTSLVLLEGVVRVGHPLYSIIQSTALGNQNGSECNWNARCGLDLTSREEGWPMAEMTPGTALRQLRQAHAGLKKARQLIRESRQDTR